MLIKKYNYIGNSIIRYTQFYGIRHPCNSFIKDIHLRRRIYELLDFYGN